MRKVILGLAITLDGFIEGPAGEYDWCFTDQDYGLNSFFGEIDAMFIGRKSYELMKQHATEDGAIPGMPDVTTYFFSRSVSINEGNTTTIGNSFAERVRAIKNGPGKNIWLFGGAELTDTLMKAGLVDELWLSIHPILLGNGKRLFHSTDERRRLKLLTSKTYETGLVSVRYRIDNKELPISD